MIKIMLGAEVKPGVTTYSVLGHAVSGSSRQPLLDACRALKALGVDTEAEAGTFRGGREEPNMFCTVGVGAATTVSEPDKGIVKFVKYQPFDFSAIRATAEVQ